MKVSIHAAGGVDIKGLISETRYATVPDAERTLQDCLKASMAHWVGSVDGKPLCVWGLIAPTFLSQQAYLWLLTSEEIKEYQFIFIRHSQMMVEEMLKEWPIITGHCVVGESKSIRWIKWLGGTFGEPDGKKIPFQIVRKP